MTDTSKEAVEFAEEFCRAAEERRDGEGGPDYIAAIGHTLLYASDLRALLSERDALRAQLQAARDEALEEAAKVSDDHYLVDDKDVISEAIRALKSTSAQGEG